MSNFNNNEQENQNNQEVSNYSFWAEQVNNSSNMNPNSVYIQNNEPVQNNEPLNAVENVNYQGINEHVNYKEYYNGNSGASNSENNIGNAQQNSDNGKKVKKQGKFFKKAVSLIVSAAVFGVVASASFQGMNYFTKDKEDNNKTVVNSNSSENNTNSKIETTKVTSGISSQSADVSGVVENTMPSIVSITSIVTQTYQDWFGETYDKDSEGSGSGIIVGKNDDELLIATNNHVVAASNTIKVKFIDDEIVEAEIKGTDSTADLAVIAVKLSDLKKSTLDAIKIAVLGDSDQVKVGQMAIAIGNALGYGQSTTVGYISAKDREVYVDGNTMTLIQTDAAINPGNSGGALLNVNGEVIGINSAKYSDNAVEGMGFAIPISRATPIINELMNRENLSESEQGYMGITGEDVSDEGKTVYEMPSGAYVKEVVEGSPADKGGIKKGDIITAVNGMEVSGMTALKEKVNAYRAGTEITLTISRLNEGIYKAQEIKVTLTDKTIVENNTNSGSNESEQQKEESKEDSSQNGSNPFQGFDFFNR